MEAHKTYKEKIQSSPTNNTLTKSVKKSSKELHKKKSKKMWSKTRDKKEKISKIPSQLED